MKSINLSKLYFNENMLFYFFWIIGLMVYFLANILVKDRYIFLILFCLSVYSLWAKARLTNQAQNRVLQFFWKNVDIAAAIILFFVYLLLPHSANDIFTALFVIVFIFSCIQKDWIAHLIFENKIIVFIGSISFSIFLTHTIVITILKPISLHYGIKFFVELLLSIVLSTFTYYYIEQPGIRWGKKLLNNY